MKKSGRSDQHRLVLRECRNKKEERGCESHFSEDLQTLLFSHLCLAAL